VGDLAAVLADRLMLESGFPAAALARGLAPYHEMRTDMAIGQFLDLALVTVDPAASRRIAALKGGSYTVEGPLLVGSALAGGTTFVETRLRRFGAPLGEAFQLRDDLLGIFGSPAITGKPVCADLTEHKATSVVVAAHHMADPTMRSQLNELMSTADLDEADVERWRSLIAATGAEEQIEAMIADRLRRASDWIDEGRLDDAVRSALLNMASVCTERAS
jgi:geranylgeranyl diphosphate synthase type I